MNDEPLPRLHGGPVRVVVPGYIGARSVKWVTGVTVQDQPSANYFQATAYRLVPAEADPAQPGVGISLGAFAVTSAITAPRAGDVVAAGPVTVRGYAVAGDGRQVARVDVSADGGRSWRQAVLDAEPEPGVWRLWYAAVDLSGVGGEDVELVARAWDDTAAVQPDSAADLWNPKGYANNARPRTWVSVARSDAQKSASAG
jgi:sulfite oxidase